MGNKYERFRFSPGEAGAWPNAREAPDRFENEWARFDDESHSDSDPERLRDALTALKATLADREMALAKAALDAEQARESWQQESEAALLKAEEAWKARLAEAEAKWRKESAKALAEATARCEAAESVLAQLKKEAAYGSRDGLGRTAQPIEDSRRSRALTRDVVIVAVAAVLLITAYPSIAPFLPESWQSSIDSFTGGVGSIAGHPGPAPAVAPTVSPNVAARRLATVVGDVNVRAGPSAETRSVSTLRGGSSVTIIDRRGSWVLVQMEGGKGHAGPVQGWVSGSFLKDEALDKSAQQARAK